MKSLWLILLLTPFILCDNQEIITLRNATHLMCIANDQNSAIYVDPPLTTTQSETEAVSEFLQRDEFWNDWLLKKSFELATMQEDVLDKRWENFAIIKNNYNLFQNVSSVSFSIYSPDLIEFYMNDLENLDYYERNPENSKGSWKHYSIISNNGGFTIYEDSRIIHSMTDLIPQDIVVKTPSDMFWKIRNYPLRMTTQVSRSPTNVIVPPDLDCLTIYVSLCPHCSLLAKVDEKEHRFFGKESKTHTLSVKSESRIALTRGVVNGTEGFWQIDAWQCPITKSGKAIYEANLNEINRGTCNTLTDYIENKNRRRKRTANERSLFECKSGWLGRSCDIRCEDFLGHEKDTCQEYEICERFSSEVECHCAWGYGGTFCKKPCLSGTWGLNCKQKCPSECPSSCNSKTGECQIQKTSKYTTEPAIANVNMLVFVIAIVSGTIFVSTAITLYYRKKFRQPQVSCDEEAEVTETEDRLLHTV